MKNSLKATALLIAAGFPCAAFADILGAKLPAAFQLENAMMLFPVLLIGLTLASDYSKRRRTVCSAVACGSRNGQTSETHRLAA